ncbi:MAG: phosphoribosylamine--glycine ligase [Anaerolineae bacterium]|jgi:phosphoribosylamine--glycine ligase
MRVLVVGSGGREHALAWALSRSPAVNALHVAPGNAGTQTIATNVPISAEDVTALREHCRRENYDLVVVGPEAPLAAGLTDLLLDDGLRVFGPQRQCAQIEASKAFSKDFMVAHGIPTAPYATFTDYEQARHYLNQHGAPIVIKASGLAAGKGVIVCQTLSEAQAALDTIMRQRAFGAAGDLVVLEDCLTGQEASVLAFADGETVVPMVVAQDHKAAYDGDRGPNTGGMGCYAPADLVDEAMVDRVVAEVLQPAVDGMRADGCRYVGVLYAGLMLQDDDFQVLEFNCRFGDPETQVILPLLETDLAEIMEACVDGRLAEVEVRWSRQHAVCVVMASGGYPGSYAKGLPIEGLDEAAAQANTMIFHAGTRLKDGRVLTAGGRVLGVTAWDDTLALAKDRAYEAVERIHWSGAVYRTDIGAKGLGKAGEA